MAYKIKQKDWNVKSDYWQNQEKIAKKTWKIQHKKDVEKKLKEELYLKQMNELLEKHKGKKDGYIGTIYIPKKIHIPKKLLK